MSEDDPKWVCRGCIGHDNFSAFTIGLIGTEKCSVCGSRFPQPQICFVSNKVYMEACARMIERTQQADNDEQMRAAFEEWLNGRVTSDDGRTTMWQWLFDAWKDGYEAAWQAAEKARAK